MMLPAGARPLTRRAVMLGAALAASLPPAARGAPPASVALWGDSLTLGSGADTVAGKYPNRLGRLFEPTREVFNGGVGGESSTDIAARMVADTAHRNWISVIWAGRNNYGAQDRVMADIAAMAGHLAHDRFLVLSIPNAAEPSEDRGGAGHDEIVRLNEALRARYGGRFVDIRAALVAQGLARLGLAATPQDRRDVEHDVPPSGLRADHIHLNDAGQEIVALRVRDGIVRHGW